MIDARRLVDESNDHGEGLIAGAAAETGRFWPPARRGRPFSGRGNRVMIVGFPEPYSHRFRET